jgi:uncharacterized protein YodC (DUF2158 family)
MMSKGTFNPGDKVTLKSGGPLMTIAHWSEMHQQWLCQWFDGPKLQSQYFGSVVLEAEEPAA